MHKALRDLPSLDFLRGFEAAGRRLSFTLAAEELFVTQSALSRQIKALEDALGIALFVRRHRALALTPAGLAFHRDVTTALGALAIASETVRGVARTPGLAVSTTVSFASLWIIPRLSRFRARHPDVEVYVSADDRMLPVVSPALIRRGGAPLKSPADLARHVLLHLDDPEGRMPWLNWPAWLNSNGAPDLKPAGSLRFSIYDQVIQAAVSGQGIALGRIPMIAEHLRDGRLVSPFPKRYDSARGYYVLVAPSAGERTDV